MGADLFGVDGRRELGSHDNMGGDCSIGGGGSMPDGCEKPDEGVNDGGD